MSGNKPLIYHNSILVMSLMDENLRKIPGKLLFVPVLVILMQACAVTGPPDDRYEKEHAWDENERLLTDEARTLFRSKENLGSQTNGPGAGAGIEKPVSKGIPITTVETDFMLYKQWLKGRDVNSGEYQKFRRWMEFEQFYCWKEKHRLPQPGLLQDHSQIQK